MAPRAQVTAYVRVLVRLEFMTLDSPVAKEGTPGTLHVRVHAVGRHHSSSSTRSSNSKVY